MFVAAARGVGATLRPPGPGWVSVATTRTRAAGLPGPRADGATFPGRGVGSWRPHSPGHAALIFNPWEGDPEKERGRLPLDRT